MNLLLRARRFMSLAGAAVVLATAILMAGTPKPAQAEQLQWVCDCSAYLCDYQYQRYCCNVGSGHPSNCGCSFLTAGC